MEVSLPSKIAGLLPRLGGRIPTQDFSEDVTIIIKTTGYIENIVNDCSPQSHSWCWKLAGLPPLQLAPTSSVDCNLVGVRVSVVKDFLFFSCNLGFVVFMLCNQVFWAF